MTGKELIIYILQNDLEDKQLFENGQLLGFMSDVDAAVKFGVGLQTIRLWYGLGQIEGVMIGKQLYIPANAENPLSKGDTNGKENDSSFVTVFMHNNG